MLEVDMPKLPDAVYDKLPPDAPGNGDIAGYNRPRGHKTFFMLISAEHET